MSFFEFPLIRRELLKGLLRTRRAFWLLVTLVALSALLPLFWWPSSSTLMRDFYTTRYVFMFFGVTQLATALLIIPAFTVGAISGEREGGTYELLFTTLLSPWSIVLSKFIASTTYVLILLVATAPAAAIVYLLGGIGFASVLTLYGLTLLSVAASGLVCLTVSMRSSRTGPAAVRSYAWLACYNGGFLLLFFLVFSFLKHGPLGLDLVWPNWVLGLSPFTVLFFEAWPEELALGPLAIGQDLLSVYAAYTCLLGGVHLLYLLWKVRQPELGFSARGSKKGRREDRDKKKARKVRRSILARSVMALGRRGIAPFNNPVFQKDVSSEFFSRRGFRRSAFWLPFFFFLLLATLGGSVRESGFASSLAALVLLTLIAPGVMAGSFAREHENQSMDLLRGTLMPMRQVLAGKFFASVYGVFGIVAAWLWIFLVPKFFFPRDWYASTGSARFTFASVFLPILVVTVTLFFTVSVAALFSVISRRSLGALLGTYLTLVGVHVGVPTAVMLGGGWADATAVSTSAFGTLSFAAFGGGSREYPSIFVLFTLFYGGATAINYVIAANLADERSRDA